MARNVDTEIFKKSASRGRDFPEQQNFLAPTGQLSKWVWDKILEPTRPSSTSTEEFAVERYSEIISARNIKCKCLTVISVWAKYCFLISFIILVDARKKSRLDPSAQSLSIPRTKFK